MTYRVTELRDPHEAYERARDYLLARPADHNLLHTILDQAREFAVEGRFWIVGNDEQVAGFALQSPLNRGVVLGRMNDDAIHALAEAVAPPVPDALGDASTVAAFAGHFAACHRIAVTNVSGRRFYELTKLRTVPPVPGAPRPATPADRLLLTEWLRAFTIDMGEPVPTVERAQGDVDLRIGRERFWVWDHDGLKSMVASAAPTGGVARIGPVYTPPELRGSGYATACTHYVSQGYADRGLRCVLYTDLANPTSNAIYQRIGYAPIAEILRYEFAAG